MSIVLVTLIKVINQLEPASKNLHKVFSDNQIKSNPDKCLELNGAINITNTNVEIDIKQSVNEYILNICKQTFFKSIH